MDKYLTSDQNESMEVKESSSDRSKKSSEKSSSGESTPRQEEAKFENLFG